MIPNTKLKVLFFGSSEYCQPVVESLNHNFQLVAIISKKHQSLEKLAQKLNILTFTPQDKKELSTLKNKIHSLEPDISVVADYGLIIPKDIFEIPKYKTLNIHFSRLPDLRGAAPIQFTILRGDKNAWITVQLLDVSFDTGDIIWQKSTDLDGNETTDSLYKKLFNIASVELPDIISKYVRNVLKPIKQDHSKATYSKILTREDGFIPPKLLADAIKGSSSGVKLERTIRAFTPWPSAWTRVMINGKEKRLKLLKAHIEENKFVPDLIQLEGKKPVSWKQFFEGYPDIRLEV